MTPLTVLTGFHLLPPVKQHGVMLLMTEHTLLKCQCFQMCTLKLFTRKRWIHVAHRHTCDYHAHVLYMSVRLNPFSF